MTDPTSTAERLRSLAVQAVHLDDRPSTRFLRREKVSPADVRELMAALAEADDFIGRLPSELSPEDQAGAVEAVFHRLDQIQYSEDEGLPLEEAVNLFELTRAIQVFALEGERLADIPPRKWWAFFTVGLNLIMSKKGIGKTAFIFDMVYSMGGSFMGMPTPHMRVLLVETELDRLSIHERAGARGPAPEGVDVLYEFPRGDEALRYLEALVRTYGYELVVIDMLQAVLPLDLESNNYDSGHYLLSLRRLAQRLGFILVTTWHQTKAARDDWLDSAMGSTAIVSQADVIISLERDRGASTGKLRTCGNHGNEQTLSVVFEGGRWAFDGEGRAEEPRTTEWEREILATLTEAPAGASSSMLAAVFHKTPDAMRTALGRLSKRNLVVKNGKTWSLADRTEPNKNEQIELCSVGQPEGKTERTEPSPIGGRSVVRPPESRTWDDFTRETEND